MASTRFKTTLRDWVFSEIWVKDRNQFLQKLENLGIYKVSHLIQFPVIYCQLECLGLDNNEERSLVSSTWKLEKDYRRSSENIGQLTIEEWISHIHVSNPDECVQRFHDLGIEQTSQLPRFPHIHELLSGLKLKIFEKMRLIHAMQLLVRGVDYGSLHNISPIRQEEMGASLFHRTRSPVDTENEPVDIQGTDSLEETASTSEGNNKYEKDFADLPEPNYDASSDEVENYEESFEVIPSNETVCHQGNSQITHNVNDVSGMPEGNLNEISGTSAECTHLPIKRKRGRPRKGERVQSPGVPGSETSQQRRKRKDRENHRDSYKMKKEMMIQDSNLLEQQREKWRLGKRRERQRKSLQTPGIPVPDTIENIRTNTAKVHADSSTVFRGVCDTSGAIHPDKWIDELQFDVSDDELPCAPIRPRLAENNEVANNQCAQTKSSIDPSTIQTAQNAQVTNPFDIVTRHPTDSSLVLNEITAPSVANSMFPSPGPILDHTLPANTQNRIYDIGYATNSAFQDEVAISPNTSSKDPVGVGSQDVMPFSPVYIDNILTGAYDNASLETRPAERGGAVNSQDQSDEISSIGVVNVHEVVFSTLQEEKIKRHTKLLWEVKVGTLGRGVDFTQTGDIICCAEEGVRMFSADGKQADVPFDTACVENPWSVAVNQQTGDVIITEHRTPYWFVYTKNDNQWRQKVHWIGGQWECGGPVTWTHTGQIVRALRQNDQFHLVKYDKGDNEEVWSCNTECHSILDVAVDSRGYIYCCDCDDECVRVYNTEGSLSHTVPRDPDTVHTLPRPESICVDSRDRLLVLHQEVGVKRMVVSMWDSAGAYMTKILDMDPDSPGQIGSLRLHNDRNLVLSSDVIRFIDISSVLQIP